MLRRFKWSDRVVTGGNNNNNNSDETMSRDFQYDTSEYQRSSSKPIATTAVALSCLEMVGP